MAASQQWGGKFTQLKCKILFQCDISEFDQWPVESGLVT